MNKRILERLEQEKEIHEMAWFMAELEKRLNTSLALKGEQTAERSVMTAKYNQAQEISVDKVRIMKEIIKDYTDGKIPS